MINTSEHKSEDTVKSGVVEYPIGFNFYFNIDKTPQLLVKIGDEELRFNYNFELSEDQGSVVLRPTQEETMTLEGPEDFSWMSKWDGKDLLIERAIPLVQDSDYQLGRISSEQIERDFDLSVMRDQMLAGKTDALDEAIQKTRDDMNAKDSQLETTLKSHTSELTTLRGNQVALGNRVSGIESKIPESASDSNQLATKEDLANIDLDDFVKKSGDTMTGDLVMSSDTFNTKAKLTTQGAAGRTTLIVSTVDAENENVSTAFEFERSGALVVRHTGIGGENMGSLGTKNVPMRFVYAKRLNSADGDSQLGDRERDLIIPSVGGTLARMEDLVDLRAGIATKAEKDSVYTKEQVDAKVSSVYKVKGSVSTESALPTNPSVGDVYNVLDTGANYVWSSEGFWDKLGDVVDLSGYATKDELSNYLPTTGGEMTGNVRFNDAAITFASASDVDSYRARITWGVSGLQIQTGQYGLDRYYLDNTKFWTSSGITLGSITNPWSLAYIQKLNNGADLIVPTEGGTLARLEDLEGLGGGDYLPLAGGTLAGKLDIKPEVSDTNGTVLVLSYGVNDVVIRKNRYSNSLMMDKTILTIGGLLPSLGGSATIGSPSSLFKSVHAERISGSTSYSDEHYLLVPNKDGTIATVEDIDAVVGDISTALTAILGE